MAKKAHSTAKTKKQHKKRPGVHAKTKTSKVKGSKFYKKKYVGQGK